MEFDEMQEDGLKGGAQEELGAIKKSGTLPLIYSVDDKPSWGLSFLLGMQVSPEMNKFVRNKRKAENGRPCKQSQGRYGTLT